MDDAVPALVGELNKVRIHHSFSHFGFSVFAVHHLHPDTAFHGVDEFVQVLFGRNGLQHNAVMHTFVVGDDAVLRLCGEHPVLVGILFQHFVIVDILPESVLLVELDVYAEDIQNGIPVAVERAAGNGNALAQFILQPAFVDLFERDSVLCLVDGVYQPDVLLKSA